MSWNIEELRAILRRVELAVVFARQDRFAGLIGRDDKADSEPLEKRREIGGVDAAKLTLCSAGCDGAAMGYFPACSLCEIVESLSDLTQFKVPGSGDSGFKVQR